MRDTHTRRQTTRTRLKPNRWQGLQFLESRVLLSAIPLAVTTVLPDITNDTTPTIAGTVGDVGAEVQVAILHHGGTPVGTFPATTDGAGHWTFTLPAPDALSDGHYDMAITASDNGGADTGELDALDSLIVDTVAPDVSITNLTANVSNPTLIGTVGTDVTSLSVTVAGTTYTSGSGAVVLTGSGDWSLALPTTSDGAYAISATAADPAGNVNTVGGHLLIDTVAPVVAFDQGQLPATIEANTHLTGTFVEANIASIYVTLDNGLGGTFSFPAAIGTGGTWSAPITVAGVPDGAYAVRVTATDLAASLTAVTASGQLTNATPPSVALGTTVTNDATPPLTGTIDDPTAAVVVTVCGADYPATNDGHGTWTLADNTLATLPDGTYRVIVEATNTLDIQGTCSALLVVDAAAPVITVHSLVTTSTSPALSGAVNDSGADVAVTVNSVTYAATNNGDGTWSLGAGAIAALTPGVYSVTATATNALGTVGTDTTSHELTIGTTQVVTFSSTITKIVYVDADGTMATVTASGGAVALSLTGVGTMVTATGKTRTVSATGGIVQVDVNVPANTPKTTPSLTFTTNASGDAQTTINQINGSGNLKSLTGKAVTLAGGINMTGYIQTLTLHAIASNIQMGTFAGGVTVTADTIANSTIHTGVIAKLTATLSFENSTLDATTIGTAALTNVLNAAISAVSITKSLSLANVRDTNVNAATIGKVTMSSVRNTNLTAATIGALALTNVQVNNGGTHFGVTATSKLTSLKLVQSGITLTWGKQFLTHILDFTVTA